MDAPVRKVGATDSERFWGKVDKTDSCWNWTGAKQNGYGIFRIGGRSQIAHRVSYMWANGDIPEGAQMDHMCHNRSCINPEHLRFADHALNGQNRSTANSNSKSGIRGVYWLESGKCWMARAMLNRAHHEIGRFSNMGDAEQAVIQWRRENMPYSLMDRKAS